MGKRVSIRHKRKEAPTWVFSWRPLGESLVPRLLALGLVSVGFVFLMGSVRIRVIAPTPWATHKASVIHVGDDADSRALTLRAREGGPFPSRFEPSEWEGAVAIEQAAFAAARWSPPPYTPKLRELPEDTVIAPPLAAKGVPVLPKRAAPLPAAPMAENLRLKPVLYPLSGIDLAALPQDLPPFEGEVDETMATETWRFLAKLNASGHVTECVSLAGGDEAGPPPLVKWLRSLTFKPDPAPSRWISVGVGFTIQPQDGPDTR